MSKRVFVSITEFFHISQLSESRFISAKNPGDPYAHAVLYARVGKKDDAFGWLEKAYQARSQELIYSLRTDPAFDALRSDPRYADLVHRIGFLPLAQ